MGKNLGTTGFSQHENKFSGIYRGKVISTSDTSQLGRIQIRIYPMLEGVTSSDLPWAVPAFPIYDGANTDTGCFVVPKVDSMVFCFFEEGDIYQPVYFAEAQDALKGLPTERTTDYPTTKVWKTSGGYIKTLNDTLGDEYVNIVNDKELDVGNDDTETIGQHQTTTVTGNKTTTVGITNTLVTVLNYICTIGYNFTMTVVNMASIVDLTGERLAQTGDIKSSLNTTHNGWLMLKPDTVGNTGSGATYAGARYAALFTVLKDCAPNTGSESFSGLDTVTLPDFRGRSPLGLDNMGGSQANVLTTAFVTNRNVLGGEDGSESHQLTVAELAKHRHTDLSGAGGSGEGAAEQILNQAGYTGYEGDSDAHNNVGPSIMCNWFIKI